ncbi:MAG: DUF1318 domain-containing protein [Phycisphaeraceae bacterium]
MNRRLFMMMLLAGATALMSTTAARADEKSDLQARFKERFARLSQLRGDGTVGETWEGWVKSLKEAAPEIAALIEAENTDRAKLCAIIAKEIGATPEEVGRRNALRIFRSAEPNHYLMTDNGKWVQKKDLKSKE